MKKNLLTAAAEHSWLLEEEKELKDVARTRALKRYEEREHLRFELKARGYIQLCHEVADTLQLGREQVENAEGQMVDRELSRVRVQALKASADIALRLLDRVLPPLKAIEVEDSPGKDLKDYAKMSTQELLALARAHQIPLEGEFREIRPEEDNPFG